MTASEREDLVAFLGVVAENDLVRRATFLRAAGELSRLAAENERLQTECETHVNAALIADKDGVTAFRNAIAGCSMAEKDGRERIADLEKRVADALAACKQQSHFSTVSREWIERILKGAADDA